MKITEFIKHNWFPVLLSAVIVTGFLTKENPAFNKLQSSLKPDSISEIFYRPEGDTRVWHVINTYTSPLIKDTTGFKVSEYLFTADTVTVKNRFTGIDLSDLFAINKLIK